MTLYRIYLLYKQHIESDFDAFSATIKKYNTTEADAVNLRKLQSLHYILITCPKQKDAGTLKFHNSFIIVNINKTSHMFIR